MELSVHAVGKAKSVISKNEISRIVARASQLARKSLAFLSVVFVRDAAMRKLNTRYRHVAHATDVLSFALTEGMRMKGAKASGEIFLNTDEIVRQSRKRKANQKTVAKFLLVHGFLHCCGFDHGTPRQLERMRRYERRVCGKHVYYE